MPCELSTNVRHRSSRMLTVRGRNLSPILELQTEEDAKLSRILSKQRYHRQQLLSQPLSAPTLPRPTSAPAANTSHTGGDSQEGGTPDASLLHTAPSSAWPGLKDLTSEHTERSAPQHCQDLTLQDVSVDDEYDSRSQTSQLESESVYLPLGPGEGPRPMTAPSLSNPQPPSPLSPSPLQPARPATSLPREEARDTNKYEAYDRRPVKPLNQDILRGVLKPKFDFSPPQTSRADPAKHCHKAPVATAESVECGTSVENSVAEDAKPAMEPPTKVSEPPALAPRIPSHELSLIKDRAGAKRAQAAQKVSTGKSSTSTHSDVAHKRSTSAITSHTAHHRSQAAVRQTGNESKRAKGRVNQARAQAASAVSQGDTLGSSLGTTHDSGFLSRPCSDAVVEATLDEHKAAAIIQSLWRGYWTRNFHPAAVSVRKEIRARRAEDHITILRTELARQKKLYEEERKLRTLQMEAIRCLWHEVQSLQNWKNEVLSRESQKSSPDYSSKQLRFALSDRPSTCVSAQSDTLTSTGELDRHRDLERTCLSLQSQVSHLQDALDSISSAVFQTSSLPVSLTDTVSSNSSTLVVSAFDEDEDSSLITTPDGSPKSARWSSVPHSLSPYPSEEEESYFSSAPHPGAPTPPRSLTMTHRGDNSILLRWQPSRLFDDQGNDLSKGIIGYRVYVNDGCKALIPGNRTSALASGLDSSLTYKLYVKALSGLGESNESNVLMAKLAVGETRRTPQSSDSDVSYDSDRDCDTAENHDKIRLRKRDKRKPRVHSPRTEKQSNKQGRQTEGQRKLDRKSAASPSPDSMAAILTHPKLHTHRRTRSKDYTDGMQGDTSHFRPGTEGEKPRLATAPPGNHGDGSFPPSPKSPKSIMKTHSVPLSSQRPATAMEGNFNQNCSAQPPPGKGESLGGVRDEEETLLKSGQTFTVDDARSYLKSLSRQLPATPETPPHPVHPASTPPRPASPARPPSPYRTHRRKRSSESSEVGSEVGSRDPRAEITETAASIAASTAKILGQAYDSQGFDPRADSESNESGKVKTHRRKRSKDLNRESPDRREGEGGGEGGGRSLPVLDGRTRHSSGSRPASPMLAESPGATDRDSTSALSTASTTSTIVGAGTTTSSAPERRRLPVAELMEQRLQNLNRNPAQLNAQVQNRRDAGLDVAPPSRSHSDLAAESLTTPTEGSDMVGSRQRPHVVGSEGDLVSASSGGSGGAEKTEGSGTFVSKLLQKLQTFSKSQEESLREKKLRSKRSTDSSSGRDSRPPSDDEGRKRPGRVRHRSESDSEVATDANLPPRAPAASDSSSGSHSDDNRSGHRHGSHRRTPSDHQAGAGVMVDPRPTHSPIIMEGGRMGKSSSGVRRHASFHGILPSKTRDAKPSTSGTEEASAKPEDPNAPAKERGSMRRFRSRSRSPANAERRRPVLSAAQFQKPPRPAVS